MLQRGVEALRLALLNDKGCRSSLVSGSDDRARGPINQRECRRRRGFLVLPRRPLVAPADHTTTPKLLISH
ncbi:hypothetical protein EVAR_43506_1 [Eumeta japonica]|uniref:Uncharacterized protein n=1 Tax=Eumeta variegata TaxID=151549 RepID=A0A4C1YKK1_EUMVA|nr:hypothetical protein EVAR_43506_1 [Eumeta japonica]